jgi:hypothetical protein
MDRWISVKDDLPKSSEEVLCVIVDRRYSSSIKIGFYSPSEDTWHPFKRVTHWMPLPEPPVLRGLG